MGDITLGNQIVFLCVIFFEKSSFLTHLLLKDDCRIGK